MQFVSSIIRVCVPLFRCHVSIICYFILDFKIIFSVMANTTGRLPALQLAVMANITAGKVDINVVQSKVGAVTKVSACLPVGVPSWRVWYGYGYGLVCYGRNTRHGGTRQKRCCFGRMARTSWLLWPTPQASGTV